VIAFKPAVVCVATVFGFAQGQHSGLLSMNAWSLHN
jgi:hypothetical protein